MTRTRLTRLCLLTLLLTRPGASLQADEGMWTFDNLPLDQLRERHGFTPTQAWLDHLRVSSVRIGGSSGSFVSPDGLLMTNMHVGLGYVQSLLGSGADYVTNGFHAPTRAQELRAPNLEASVLVSLEEVTGHVQAVATGLSDAEGLRARQADVARIEKESLDATGLFSRVVSLYNGGEYWLYRYKRYTDVRLVFAPESQAAFFGGDTDNFTYPRYCLDVAFFRVYEDGTPAATPHYLTIEPAGPNPGELIFVSGNPGSTDRLFTYEQLVYQRDVRYPIYLDYVETYRDRVLEYAALGPEHARRVQRQLLGTGNSLKALGGEYRGLTNPTLMQQLQRRDNAFRSQIQTSPRADEYTAAFAATARATGLAPTASRSGSTADSWAPGSPPPPAPSCAMWRRWKNRTPSGYRAITNLSLTRSGSGCSRPHRCTLTSTRFDLYGRSTYPDATGTLRVSFGTVAGYPMNGTRAPFETTLYGLFDRALGFDDTADFALPPRYWDRRDDLDLTTPANFVTTADIIGGNSGSPVVNRDGTLVGLVFDGNIESLVGRYAYDAERARAVAVRPGYILEALAKLYDADELVDELTIR